MNSCLDSGVGAIFFTVTVTSTFSDSVGLLVISSSPVVQLNLATTLNDRPSFTVINRTDSKQRNLRRTTVLNPSIILVSIKVPKVSNVTTARSLGTTDPGLQIIVLASRASSARIVTTLSDKTSTCYVGNASMRTLTGTVHTTTTKTACLSPHVTRAIIRGLTATQPGTRPLNSNLLSNQRLRILRLVMRKLDGARVNRQLCLDPGAIGACIGKVVGGLIIDSHIRTTITTIHQKLIG